jgi:crossover junction endodeoxyribonuclease RuvC
MTGSIRYVGIGIDPGKTGGVACVNEKWEVQATPMPMAGDDIRVTALLSFIQFFNRPNTAVAVCIEKVHAMPGQGVSSMFNFGKGFGMVLGALQAYCIPVSLVAPPAWKKAVLAGLPHDKEGAVAYVTRRYPGFNLVLPKCRKPHDGMADAVCIAEYALRQAWGVADV